MHAQLPMLSMFALPFKTVPKAHSMLMGFLRDSSAGVSFRFVHGLLNVYVL